MPQKVFQLRLLSCFLVADSQLYKRLCPSVRPLVRWSVTLELKTRKTRIYDAAVVTLCVCVCQCVGGGLGVGLGWGWGLDAPAHPSTTILWPCVTCWVTSSSNVTHEMNHTVIFKSKKYWQGQYCKNQIFYRTLLWGLHFLIKSIENHELGKAFWLIFRTRPTAFF